MRLFDPQGKKSEAEIQTEFLKRANAAGWLAFKSVNVSKRGGPDTLCSRYANGNTLVAVWIEFKKVGAPPPTIQQTTRHEELRGCGYDVFWSDSVEHALEMLRLCIL